MVRRIVLAFLVVAAFVGAAFFIFVMNYSYSEGERAGYLQKFSQKGWLCKSYEGEIAMTTVPGVAPVLWDFSVWDEQVATQFRGVMGKKVVVHYREYRYLPTNCFGETGYFIDRIAVAE